jgi:hypothetical protein
MPTRLPTCLAVLLLASAGAASAADMCGAQIHTRYGETRAYFGNALGACRPDGYCSAVLALTDPTGQGVYAQQLRVALPAPGAPYTVELTAVTPMNAGDGQPMSLTVDTVRIDLPAALAPAPVSINAFEITDPETVTAIVTTLKKSRTARWTYESETGPANAWFALGGLTEALEWIDCVGEASLLP